MNKNSLKQMIVAEMILADIGEGRSESPKKRSLFDMMEDSYLAELDDNTLVHSMKVVHDIYEKVDKSNWRVKDPESGEMRQPKTSTRTPEQQERDAASRAEWAKTKAEEEAAAAAAVELGDNDNAIAVPEPQKPGIDLPAVIQPTPSPIQVDIVDDNATQARIDQIKKQRELDNAVDVNIIDDVPDTDTSDEPLALDTDLKPPSRDDTEGNEDVQGDGSDSAPSSGWAYLKAIIQASMDAEKGANNASDADVTSESRLSLLDLLYDA